MKIKVWYCVYLITYTIIHSLCFTIAQLLWGSSCVQADRVMDSHTTGTGFKTWWVWYTFYRASDWPPPYQHHKVDHWLVSVEGRGRISQWGLTQEIKMGSCVFQCDIPHQWIAHVGPVSVYCDGVGCHILSLWHGIPVWQHIGQSTTATSRHCCDMTSDV